jgi:hypothetical protein
VSDDDCREAVVSDMSSFSIPARLLFRLTALGFVSLLIAWAIDRPFQPRPFFVNILSNIVAFSFGAIVTLLLVDRGRDEWRKTVHRPSRRSLVLLLTHDTLQLAAWMSSAYGAAEFPEEPAPIRAVALDELEQRVNQARKKLNDVRKAASYILEPERLGAKDRPISPWDRANMIPFYETLEQYEGQAHRWIGLYLGHIADSVLQNLISIDDDPHLTFAISGFSYLRMHWSVDADEIANALVSVRCTALSQLHSERVENLPREVNESKWRETREKTVKIFQDEVRIALSILRILRVILVGHLRSDLESLHLNGMQDVIDESIYLHDESWQVPH